MTELPPPPPPPPVTRPAAAPREVITQPMLDMLRKTRPWVRFLSIMGFLMVGLIVLIGLGVAGFGVFTAVTGERSQGALMLGLGVLYVVMGLLYFYPSRYLARYAGAITRTLDGPSRTSALEEALRWQKSFWKFAGILTLVTLLLYIPGVIAAIAIPNFLTATQRAKQKRTMADIRSIATAVEARATDTNSYPPVASLEELSGLLEPTYIRTFPSLDGWGNPFDFAALDCESDYCGSYIVISGGKDGVTDFDSFEAYVNAGPTTTSNFNEDVVFYNGSFIRYPDGVMTE